MNAQEFWNGFKEIFKDGTATKETALKKWYRNKDYTAFILSEIEKKLENASLETSKEYYRIDLTAWKQLKNEDYYLLSEKDFEKYLWDLEVAVEHENNDKSWMDEVVKLMHITCPLRVVIGYLPMKEEKDTYISALNSEIKKVRVYNDMNKGEFLLIIGDSKCKGDKKKFCNYTPYIFRNSGFKQLL